MFGEYNVESLFISVGLEEEMDADLEDVAPDIEELERELAEAEKEMALSQAQGNWLDGYLDAMDELEDEENE